MSKKDLESLAKFKKLIKEEFYPKLKEELEKLPKQFIYEIIINAPHIQRGLKFYFYNQEINECDKEDEIYRNDLSRDILYDFEITHFADRIKVAEYMTRYFLLGKRKIGKRWIKEYINEHEMVESPIGPIKDGWENKSPFKESQLTDQYHDFKPNQITESFNYFVKLIKERAENPGKNYIDAIPEREFYNI